MSWKTNIQLIDLPQNERLEVTCKTCGHSRYESPYILTSKQGIGHLYLDEVERLLTCTNRNCGGAVRISISHQGETEGFVGGLA